MDSNLMRMKNRIAALELTVDEQIPCLLEMQRALVDTVSRLQDELREIKDARPRRQRNTKHSSE
jgi:uncharacterized coiled-coil protein SlyX